MSAVFAAVAAGAAIAWHDPKPAPVANQTPSTTPDQQRESRTSRDLNSTRPKVQPSIKTSPKPSTPATSKARTGAKRPTTKPAAPKPTGSRWVTANLNVRSEPNKTSSVVSVLTAGSKVPLTGRTKTEWVEVLLDGKPGWVKASYLSTKEPEDLQGGISQAPCKSGSEVEDGLTDDAIRVHRALCAKFDGIRSYGGMRGGGGEHSTGRAVDVMIGSDQSLGDAIAKWVRANHQELGVSEVLWAQKIWTVERSSEGWRPMGDRGSATANHWDHVHVTVYGNSGG